ncbi:MAG: hypothetical protein HUJ68_06515 [Clostridia bacterium]|nr:hypothetical protein [Clostridia bacterium]
MDYFSIFLNQINQRIEIETVETVSVIQNKVQDRSDFIIQCSEEIQKIYKTYGAFNVKWRCKSLPLKGYINFVPLDELEFEHNRLLENIVDIEENLIENQEVVVEDIKHWYPVFLFPNGDSFCYDIRNEKIVFFEHDVFDTGINLHGLVIAQNIDKLFETWSQIWFVDIYDWYEAVDEFGIQLDKPIFYALIELINNVF